MIKLSKDKLRVLFSNFGGKGIGLVASILVVRLLTTEDFAEWSYYKSFLTFLLPVAGLGMDQVFLRYSYIEEVDKEQLKKQTFTLAVLTGVFITLLGTFVIYWIRPSDYVNTLLLLFVLLQLATTQFNLFQKFYFRIVNDFSKYSLVVFLSSVFTGVALIVGAFISVEVMALMVALCFIIYYVFSPARIGFSLGSLKTITKERLKYGASIGIGGVFNKGIFVFDIIYIGNILNNQELLAGYKVASIIPFNLILVTGAILTVDFGDFVNFKRKDVVKYLVSYWKKTGLFLAPIGVVLFFFSDFIINLLFGARYAEYGELMFYYFLFIAIVIMLRSPVGQMLNAMGHASYNSVMTIAQVVLLGALFFVPFQVTAIQMILYFGGTVLLLSTVQLVKLLRL
jgi:O-antigen/teichoic acid export membrane protein